MPVSVGQTLSHYRLLEKIGEGGMGEVYLAEDTSLKRRVALKLLPEALSADREGLTRFRREAEAVAALNHPHIVTLHSIEEVGELHFLTMEHVEGKNLAQLVAPGGVGLPLLIEIASGLAEALAAAHDRGIVHRDLKPANVMLTPEGRIKVLDFGLAKLGAEPSGAPAAVGSSEPTVRGPLTGEGMVVGTVPYMAPEQLKHQAVDARTDLFALGVVLYELATGRRPFGGNSSAETVSAILRDAPPPFAGARDQACPLLEQIVERCLQKDPDARYPSARAMLEDLRALRRETESGHTAVPARRSRPAIVGVLALLVLTAAAGALVVLKKLDSGRAGPAVEVASIAVLPFVNLSADREQEYFSDGLSEDLLNSLAKIPALRVISRTSSFQFKGKNEDIRRIGEKLGAKNILEGSVRRAGTKIRITAQLIDATQGSQLWSETYDRSLDDIFEVQDEIARAVVRSLSVTLFGGDLPERSTPLNPEAYNLTLQGRYLAARGAKADVEAAMERFRRALEIDPGHAAAHAGLARAWSQLAESGHVAIVTGYAEARTAATRALALDPNLALAHAALGEVQWSFDWNWKGAAGSFERARSIDPNSKVYLSHVGMIAQTAGRFEEAIEYYQQALARDPLRSDTMANLAFAYYYAGRLGEAEAAARTIVELNPGIPRGHYRLGLIGLARGEPEAALTEFEKESVEYWRLAGLPLAYHALSRAADADAALATFVSTFPDDSAYQVAEIYAYRGANDAAFEWLDRAYEQHDTGLTQLKGNPLLLDIAGDARFDALLSRLDLPRSTDS